MNLVGDLLPFRWLVDKRALTAMFERFQKGDEVRREKYRGDRQEKWMC